jgi:uncharacterized repeat protein (TIGR01451 family)
MGFRIYVFVGLLLLGLVPAKGQTPFVCNGDFFLSLSSGGGNSQFYRVIRDPQAGTVLFNSLTNGAGTVVNAIGYRITDNFIYGIHPNNGTLYRIDANGQATTLTQLQGVSSIAGDVSPDGRYLVVLTKANNFDFQMVKIDLSSPTYATTTINLRSATTGGLPSIRVADLALDPYTGIVYAYDGYNRRLVTIDTNTGTVDDNTFPANGSANVIGAMFFDAFGNLFGYGAPIGSTGGQNTLFSIDKSTGLLTAVATGPSASGNDGCSCAYTIEMQKLVSPEQALPCERVTYTLRIVNASGLQIDSVSVRDTLPAGLRFVRTLSNPFGGTDQSVVGGQLVHYDNLQLGIGLDSIVFEVVIDTLARGSYANQARLDGLPSALGGFVLSDYPFSSAEPDPTVLYVDSLVIDPPNETASICPYDSLTLSAADHPAVYYIWDDGYRGASRTVRNSGIYAVKAVGCEIVHDTFVVRHLPLPPVEAGPDTFVCAGSSLRLQASGADSLYRWNAQPSLTNPFIANPFARPDTSTTYYLTGWNRAGCLASDSVRVEVKPLPMVDAGPDLLLCPDETATLLGSGMGNGLDYLWQPAQGLSDSSLAQPLFTPFGPGQFSYRLQLTDLWGCRAEDTVEVRVSDFHATFQKSDIPCFGLANGRIFTDAHGLSPFHFQLRDSLGTLLQQVSQPADTFTFFNLPPGTYQVQVTDAQGCTELSPLLSIVEPAAPLTASTLALSNVDCFGNNTGSLTVQARGGTAPYAYSLLGINYGPSGTFTGLGARVYEVRIRDDQGCTLRHADTIRTPTGLFGVVENEKWAACFGDSSGSVTLGGGGGTSPYSYSYDGVNYSNQRTLTGIGAGSYTAYLRDANNCLVRMPFVIGQPPLLQLSLRFQKDVACQGDASGAVALQASGGTAPYSFFQDSINRGSLPYLDSLAAGTYHFVVRDDSLCTDSLQLSISEPPALQASIARQVNVLCYGDSTGELDLLPMGGVAPYQYALNQGIPQATGAFVALPAGSYTLVVTDDSSCTFSLPIEITQPDSLNLGAGLVREVACHGDSSGFVRLTALGGAIPYRYFLQAGSGQTDSLFDQLSAGRYAFWVVDDHLCIDTLTVDIGEPDSLSLEGVEKVDVDCFGNENGRLLLAGRGGVRPFQYRQGSGPLQADSLFQGLGPGTYTFELVDDSSCTRQTVATITEPPLLEVEALGQDLSCFEDRSGRVQADASGGTVPYSWSWNEVPTWTTSQLDGLPMGRYVVQVTDSNGCQAWDTVQLAEPPLLQLELLSGSIVEAYCDWANGQAEVVATGGTPAYAFLWEGIELFAPGSDSIPAGTYLVRVVDQQGCTDSLEVEIPGVPPPRAAFYTEPSARDSILRSEAHMSSLQKGTLKVVILFVIL